MNATRAIALPTRETLLFVTRNLPCDSGCAVVDVGCGEGELAFELQRRGHRVVALDRDEVAVHHARMRGVVDARVARWPAFDGHGFDAVIFARSLHHIGDLDASVARACDALRAGGRVIVEDFAYRDVDPRLVTWFVERLERIGTGGDAFLQSLVEAKHPMEAWRARPFELFSIDAMRAALARGLEIVVDEDAPYFYRFPSEAHADRLFESEVVYARELGVPMLGRRLVAQKR